MGNTLFCCLLVWVLQLVPNAIRWFTGEALEDDDDDDEDEEDGDDDDDDDDDGTYCTMLVPLR